VDESGEELTKYGLKSPAFKVSLILGPEQGQSVLHMSKETNGKYFAKDETRKPIFEIDSALVKDINLTTQDFRGKDMIILDKNKSLYKKNKILAACLSDTPHENIYIVPAVRDWLKKFSTD